jgi:Fic family protein
MAKPKQAPDILTLLQARPMAADEEGTVTAPELARIAGVSYDRARHMARALADEGRLVPVMVRRRNAWGEAQSVKGYRIVS